MHPTVPRRYRDGEVDCSHTVIYLLRCHFRLDTTEGVCRVGCKPGRRNLLQQFLPTNVRLRCRSSSKCLSVVSRLLPGKTYCEVTAADRRRRHVLPQGRPVTCEGTPRR